MYAERNETGDITFKVGGSKIKCHRNVLAASSLKYKAQFSGAWDIEEIIDLNLDISPLAFECFIACFYVSSPGLTHDNVQDVLEMSSMTFSENVRELCAAFLIKHIDGRHFQAFDLALAFDLDDVKEFCVNEFVENFKTIMHHEKSQCTAEALSQILDLELLCPEREIFEICMPWSAAMAVAATDASTLRSLLGTSVQKIRFTSMTNEEFSEIVVKYPGFFAIRSFRNLFGHFEGKCQRCQRNGQRLLCCGQNSLTTHCPQWQGMKEFFCIFALCGCRTAMVYTLLIHHLRERRGKICSKI